MSSCLGGGEDDRLFDIGAVGADLGFGADGDRLRLRRGEPERHFTLRRSGWAQFEAEQLQELDVIAVGNPVETVDELIDHHREGLDQRDPRIGDVVVGPFRAAPVHESAGVIDQALKGSVVEIRCGQHRQAPFAAVMAGSSAVGDGSGSSGIT